MQSLGQLHWRQRSPDSGRESECQPLTTEPEVRAEDCMSFCGESEGEEGGGGRGDTVTLSHGVPISTKYVYFRNQTSV